MEESALISEVSWFQGLYCTQTGCLGQPNVSRLSRCPHFRVSLLKSFTKHVDIYRVCDIVLTIVGNFFTQSEYDISEGVMANWGCSINASPWGRREGGREGGRKREKVRTRKRDANSINISWVAFFIACVHTNHIYILNKRRVLFSFDYSWTHSYAFQNMSHFLP